MTPTKIASPHISLAIWSLRRGLAKTNRLAKNTAVQSV